uniref:Ig-like domain-containing protein n=1 Tax=Pavo cristatus TaxID=9049 RepID=A0A8C9EMS1_PAVCR
NRTFSLEVLTVVCYCTLFTVEAPKSLYTAELGSNVTMECVFPVNGKLKFGDLSVIWEKKDEVRKDVYILVKGKEDSESQHSDFQGRTKLLKENLDLGQSLLQISNVKLRDAGLYHCLIEYGGADYKTINLKVQAPYRTITQEVVSTGDKEWKLTCQSEGYPKAEVMWQNGECQDLTDKANTSYETGSDQLYRVMSTLTIKNRTCENFRCIFWNKEIQENTSANFYIRAVEYSIPASLQSSSRVPGPFPLQPKHCKHYQCARLACQEIPVRSACLTFTSRSVLSFFRQKLLFSAITLNCHVFLNSS